jgi:hypothetical protein
VASCVVEHACRPQMLHAISAESEEDEEDEEDEEEDDEEGEVDIDCCCDGRER